MRHILGALTVGVLTVSIAAAQERLPSLRDRTEPPTQSLQPRSKIVCGTTVLRSAPNSRFSMRRMGPRGPVASVPEFSIEARRPSECSEDRKPELPKPGKKDREAAVTLPDAGQ